MTRFHPVLGVLILAGAVASGCSDTAGRAVGPAPVDHDVEGSWVRTPLLNPGNDFLMFLTESAGVVTGIGTFAREAGAGGALAIAGSVHEDSLHLQVVFRFDPPIPGIAPDTTSFEGVLSTRDTMNGTLTVDGFAESIQLVRRRVNDPP